MGTKRYHSSLHSGKIQHWDSDAVSLESERTSLFNTIGEKERSVRIRNLSGHRNPTAGYIGNSKGLSKTLSTTGHQHASVG